MSDRSNNTGANIISVRLSSLLAPAGITDKRLRPTRWHTASLPLRTTLSRLESGDGAATEAAGGATAAGARLAAGSRGATAPTIAGCPAAQSIASAAIATSPQSAGQILACEEAELCEVHAPQRACRVGGIICRLQEPAPAANEVLCLFAVCAVEALDAVLQITEVVEVRLGKGQGKEQPEPDCVEFCRPPWEAITG
jgi:hypothetical protein